MSACVLHADGPGWSDAGADEADASGTDLSDILVVPSRIRQSIVDRLAEAGITVPFPQRDVRIITPSDAPFAVPARGEVAE